MPRSVGLAVVGLLLLAGCADRLVELPTDRRPAMPVGLSAGPVRCPDDTVLLTDDQPSSGAGAVPADFDGRTVLRCDVDYSTMRSSGGRDRFTVRQWTGPATPELRASFDLPDREMRPVRACAGASGGTTAVYLVDPGRRAVRVLLPTDDPCAVIRQEVADQLPPHGSAAGTTFQVSRDSL